MNSREPNDEYWGTAHSGRGIGRVDKEPPQKEVKVMASKKEVTQQGAGELLELPAFE